MKLFRHLGLMIAVFWCAAMAMAPMAAAAGAGQGMNQAHGSPGMTTGQTYGTGNQVQQGNSQDPAAPGQGRAAGNMTAPPGMDDWDPANTTAMNSTGGHGHRPGNQSGINLTDLAPPGDWDPANMTAANQTGHGRGAGNMTDLPPPGDWDPANMTAVNQTGHGQDAGNMTPPVPPERGQGQQAGQNQQQSTGRTGSDTDLIAELIAWLKAHTSS